MIDSSAPPVLSRAHWTIYLPSLIVAAIWTGVYVWADTREPPLAAIRSIALAIEAVVVPLLLLHAFLRARTLRVVVDGDQFDAQWGFPWRRAVRVPLHNVAGAAVRPAVAQRVFGGGALALTLRDGKRYLIADLAQPEIVVRAITADREKDDT